MLPNVTLSPLFNSLFPDRLEKSKRWQCLVKATLLFFFRPHLNVPAWDWNSNALLGLQLVHTARLENSHKKYLVLCVSGGLKSSSVTSVWHVLSISKAIYLTLVLAEQLNGNVEAVPLFTMLQSPQMNTYTSLSTWAVYPIHEWIQPKTIIMFYEYSYGVNMLLETALSSCHFKFTIGNIKHEGSKWRLC